MNEKIAAEFGLSAETPIALALSLTGRLESACAPVIGGADTSVSISMEQTEPAPAAADNPEPTVVILLRTAQGQVIAGQVPALCFLDAAQSFKDHLRTVLQIEQAEPCLPSKN